MTSTGGVNFGPSSDVVASVSNLINKSAEVWGAPIKIQMEDNARYEANYLMLESSKAKRLLDWHQKWDFETTVHNTIDWYKKVLAGACASSLMQEQINEYAG